MPPYWASVALVVIVAFVAAPFNGGKIGYLNIGWGRWLSVLSLTQVWVGAPEMLNPVYWTLCYEEQFYIVMALTLLVAEPAPSRRAAGGHDAGRAYCLHVLAAAAAVAGIVSRLLAQFRERLRRLRVAASAARAGAVRRVRVRRDHADPDLRPRPDDQRRDVGGIHRPGAVRRALAETRIGAALIGVGLFSYSLYLVARADRGPCRRRLAPIAAAVPAASGDCDRGRRCGGLGLLRAGRTAVSQPGSVGGASCRSPRRHEPA